MKTRVQNTSGYTLAELLVTMLITAVLGGVLFSMYLAVVRWVEPWQRGVMLENTMHVLTQRLAADLTYAEQLLVAADSLWTLTYPSGRVITYRYRDHVLTRNGRRMHGAGAAVVRVRMTPSRVPMAYALHHREHTLNPAERLDYVGVRITLQSQEHILDVTTGTALRRHRPWQPVPSTPLPAGADSTGRIDFQRRGVGIFHESAERSRPFPAAPLRP